MENTVREWHCMFVKQTGTTKSDTLAYTLSLHDALPISIPATKRLLLDIVIGYPTKEKRKKIRKKKEKVVSYNTY